jgi:short-subunit dehydrogenase
MHRQVRQSRTVVITGASAGVGRATAHEFARHGWNVGLIARDPARLAHAAREVEALGVRALALPTDVADAAGVQGAADRARGEWGRIDTWVNCAMATVFGAVRDVTPAEFARVTQVTYLGYVHGTLAALEDMRRHNAGTIVQVGSALAYRAIPLQSAYCAAKFAVRGFTDSLRSELRAEHSAIRLSMVQLPAVNTPQFDWARNHLGRKARPVAPVFQPEAIARAIYRAAIEAPRELWIGTSTIKAIVADVLAPGLTDRVLASIAIEGQQTAIPASAGAPDNLFAAVPGDFGTRGRFSAESHDSVAAVRPWTLRMLLAALAALALLAVSSAGRTHR